MLKEVFKINYKKMNCVTKYSIMFVLTFIVTFGYFFINKKSFVWHLDGLVQHNMALSYYGSWLRQIVKNIFINHTFTIPMWNFGIGYGSDIITTLNYYVLGEPINLLSAFVVPKYTEYLYGFLIVLRLYLSGLFFIQYCTTMNRKNNGVAVGAIAYVFTAYTLFAAIRHPFFVIPMMFFPLLLSGVEKILKGRKPYQFILVIVLSAISNFYFFYMMTFLTVIYTIVRCGFLYKKDLKQSVKKIFQMLVYAVIAVMISAVIFLPIITFFLGDNRHDVGYSIPLLYDFKYYQQLFSGLISAQLNSRWTIMGNTPLVLLGIFFAFRKKNIQHCSFFLIGMLLLCIPFVGSFMNGMSYISNRWLWALALLCSFFIVEYWEDMVAISIKNVKSIFLFLLAYCTILLFMENTRSLNVIIEMLLVLLLVMALVILHQGRDDVRKKKQIVIALTVIIGIAVNGFFLYSFSETNYVSEFIDSGQVYKTYQQSQSYDIKKNVKDDSFFRFGSAGTGYDFIKESKLNEITRLPLVSDIEKSNMILDYNDNASLLFGVKGIGFYWSLGNANISDYLMKTETSEYPTYMYRGIDDRAGLLSLSSVKYYIGEKGDELSVPYGFKKIDDFKKKVPYRYVTKGDVSYSTTYNLYKNKYFLPLGYTYDKFVLESEIEKKSGIEKEEAMLQAAVLEEGGESGLQKASLKSSNTKQDYTVECYEGVEYKNNKFVVTKQNAGVVIHFDNVENSELYVTLKGMEFELKNPLDAFEKNLDFLSAAQHNYLKNKYQYWEKPTSVALTFKDDKIAKRVLQTSDVDGLYNGRTDYVVNLGHSKNKRNYIVINFSSIGTYSFKEFNIVKRSYENYEENINRLKEDVLTDIVTDTNTISGTINLDKKKMLVLSVPYGDGWKAYVDGKEHTIEKVNYMYSGILLDEGNHKIELEYCTPGIKAGAMVSGIGILCLLAVILVDFLKTKRQR